MIGHDEILTMGACMHACMHTRSSLGLMTISVDKLTRMGGLGLIS